MYTSILPLRCYYMKQYIQENWIKLNKLESHNEERKKNGSYEKDKTNISELIKRFYKIQQFDEDEILRMCGIINVIILIILIFQNFSLFLLIDQRARSTII